MKTSTLVALAMVLATTSASIPASSGGHVVYRLTESPGQDYEQPARIAVPPALNVLLGGKVVSTPVSYVESRTRMLSVASGELRVCRSDACGPWSSSAPIESGDLLQVRMDGPTVPGMTVSTTVVGLDTGVTFEATARTASAAFQAIGDVEAEPSDAVDSTLARFEGWVETPIRVEGGEYRICASKGSCGSFTTAPGTIRDGDQVQLRVVAGPAGSRTEARVVAGGVSTSFGVETPEAPVDPFAFAPSRSNDASAVVVSSTAVAGVRLLGAELLLQGVSAAEVSINGGPFGPPPATIERGDGIRIRTTMPTVADGAVASIVLRSGDVSAEWVLSVADKVPASFAFARPLPAVPSASVESDVVAISGIDSPTAVSIGGEGSPEWRVVPDGSWSGSSGTISPGARVQVRIGAPAAERSVSTAQLSVGGVTAAFRVETGRSAPDPFSFADTAATSGDVATSSAVELVGNTIPAGVELDPGLTMSVGGSFGRPATVPPGARIALRADAPSGADGASRTYAVRIGGVAATWTTVAADTTPDAFDVVDLAGEDLGAVVSSDPVVPKGYTHRTTVSVTGQGDPEVSIDDGPWTTTATIAPGSSFRVRLRVASTPLASRSATVVVGGRSTVFSIVSAGVDDRPDAFSVATSGNADPSGIVVSDLVTPTGFDAATLLSVAGPGEPMVSVAGRTYARTARIRPGESYRIRATASSRYEDAVSYTASIGGISSDWRIETRAYDATPDPIVLDTATGLAGLTQVVSPAAPLVGFKDRASIVVENGEVSVDGGDFAATASAMPGQSVRLRTTTPDPDGISRTVTMRASGTSIGSWTVVSVDTTMNRPWTDAELASTFTTPVLSGNRTSPRRTLSGFSTPTPFLGASCTASVGSPKGINAGITVNGAVRQAGYNLNPGDEALLRLGVSGYELGSEGTCVWRFVGFEITAPWKVVGDQPNPTGTQSLPFHTGLTVGQVVETPEYRTFGNKSPSLVNVSAGSTIEIAGDGKWLAGGSSYRVPTGSYFKIRSTAIQGNKRVEIRQGETLATRQYIDLTTAAAIDGIASRITGSMFPTDFSSDVVNANVIAHYAAMPTGINACVPITLKGKDGSAGAFTSNVRNNGNTDWNYGPSPVGEPAATYLRKHYVCPGEAIRLYVQTPSVIGETVESILTVGDYSQTLRATLEGGSLDGDPDTIAFSSVDAAEPGAAISSSILTPSGFNAPTKVSIAGDGDPEFRVAGGAWTRASSIKPGQTVQVRMTAGSATGSTQVAVLSIGSVKSSFVVSTQDTTPEVPIVPKAEGVDPSANLVSTEIVVSGLGQGVRATASVSGTDRLSLDGGSLSGSVLVQNGSRLRMYVVAPTTYETQVDHQLRIGASTASWSVATRAEDTVPEAFAVPSVTGASRSSLVLSTAVSPTGYRDPTTISLVGTEAQVSVEGGAFSQTARIAPGERFVVRTRSSAQARTTTQVVVTVGGVASTWNVVTGD